MHRSKKAKVLVCDEVSDEGIEILRRDLEVDVSTHLTQDDLVSRVHQYDGIVVRSANKITRQVIEAGKELKFIARAGIGVDNIDLDAATENGIVVINTPTGPTISTAEHTFAMLLALSRKIPQAHSSLKSGKWEKSSYVGTELYGKILGIIGLGRIGSEVAKRARAFGMRMLAYDPYVSSSKEKLGVKLVDLDELLGDSDFISIHTQLTDETYHMIGHEEIAKMKKGVGIINCARGEMIDEGALLEGIKSGKVTGAALDVFENEPPFGNELLKLDEVIVTPHLGASTREAQSRIAVSLANDVLMILNGKPVKSAVNPQVQT